MKTPIDSQGALLNEQQAAEILQIEPRTVRLWRQRRGLPHIKITPRVVRFRRSDLDEWIARHSVSIAR